MKTTYRNCFVCLWIAATCLWLSPDRAQACAVCAGAAGETATNAAGHAILFMLGVVFFVLGGIVAVVVTMLNRARKYSESVVTSGFQNPNHNVTDV